MLEDFHMAADKEYEHIFTTLAITTPCDYEVQRYSSSLSQLILNVTPYDSNGNLNLSERLFIAFRGVKYIQLLPFWKNSPLQWLQNESREDFLLGLGLDPKAMKRIPRIVFAKVEKMNICIVFSAGVSLHKAMPQVEEYSFK
jgi:hypothetical protein